MVEEWKTLNRGKKLKSIGVILVVIISIFSITTISLLADWGENVSYPISVSIGGKELDAVHSQQFGWFILPLVTTDGFGEYESGIRAMERVFFSSCYLANGPYVRDWGPEAAQWEWNFIVEDDCSLYNTGGSAAPGSEIHAYIVTNPQLPAAIEDRVFNLTYNANSGILKSLTFTNTEGGDPSSGRAGSVSRQSFSLQHRATGQIRVWCAGHRRSQSDQVHSRLHPSPEDRVVVHRPLRKAPSSGAHIYRGDYETLLKEARLVDHIAIRIVAIDHGAAVLVLRFALEGHS